MERAGGDRIVLYGGPRRLGDAGHLEFHEYGLQTQLFLFTSTALAILTAQAHSTDSNCLATSSLAVEQKIRVRTDTEI